MRLVSPRSLAWILSAALAFSQRAAAQEPLPRETVVIPGTAVRFELVRVPGGRAVVGSPEGEPGRQPDEGPVREVPLGPFWIGAREVTWEEYSLYYESYKQEKIDGVTRPSQPDVVDPKEPFPNGAEQTARHPALSIGWYGAVGYCEWLSRKTGHSYRLPTEAEWEYACRAGLAAPAPHPLAEYAWFQDNSGGQTHPVGGKKPNAWGLYDVWGNAWELCLEPYAPPGFGPVVRGGAWNSPASEVRAANRQTLPEEWAERDPKRPLRLWWLTDGPFVGFRVVRVEGGDSEAERRAAAQVEFRNVRIVRRGKRPDYLDRVEGEVVYKGTVPVRELEVTVYFLDEDGKPMRKDPKEKPAFNVCHPVLVHSYHEGGHRRLLRPGETRSFALDVPHPFIEAGPLDLDRVAAEVSRIHLVRE